MTAIDDLRAAMAAAGIDPANAPMVADGRLRRFHLSGDSRESKNGYLTLFNNGDGSYGASYGSWKLGIRKKWHSGKPQRELTTAEKRAYAQMMEQRRRLQADEQRQRHAAAAEKARRLWQQAKPAAADHPYLIRKQVKPLGLRQLGEALVVPLHNAEGHLTGVQFITPDGGKRFLSGTEVAGCYHAIGGPPKNVVLLAEGFATGATLHEATSYPVAICFSAGNLLPVAVALRKKYPTTHMVICSDADPVGRAAAQEAAEAVNGCWIEPNF
ncbi:MAG: toprim domain-containing protein [Desulfuromonas thiophila]|nr:toprim domain-containing protein [Desulfuromonas thiophila]